MLTQARVRELFTYEPETGAMIRRISAGGKLAGTRAGGVHHSEHRTIRIDGERYQITHVIWLYVHGRFPAYQIDHRNLDGLDDRLENLREATHGQNHANKAAYSNNACGLKGVHRFKSRGQLTGKWRAQIKKDGRVIHLGLFDSGDAAAAAYRNAAKELHGEFARAAPPSVA